MWLLVVIESSLERHVGSTRPREGAASRQSIQSDRDKKLSHFLLLRCFERLTLRAPNSAGVPVPLLAGLQNARTHVSPFSRFLARARRRHCKTGPRQFPPAIRRSGYITP